MTSKWMDTERRLIEALVYVGAVITDHRGEPFIAFEDDDSGVHQLISVEALAQALEHLK
jgi:hypothetical protein